MMRLNSFMGNVCTVASHHNIHGKLQVNVSLFYQKGVDRFYHLPRVIYCSSYDMCTHNGVGYYRSSLTLFRCQPVSKLCVCYLDILAFPSSLPFNDSACVYTVNTKRNNNQRK